MLRRAFVGFAASLALSACQPAPREMAITGPAVSTAMPTGSRVALLAPLTGPRAEIGTALQRGAQLALPAAPPAAVGAAPGRATVLDVRDTGGTPDGAARAARAAIAGGAGLIIGPLTAAETATVAAIAQPAGVPVLAFTNDATQARPGVWTLGITPRQQVERLLLGLKTQGKLRTAALLPQTDLGRAMAAALRDAAAAQGLPPPILRDYADGMANVTAAVKDIADDAARRGATDPQAAADRPRPDAEGPADAATAPRATVPPPAFDALLLADTGTNLGELASLLPYYDVKSSEVRFMGPAIWASGATGSRQLPGAWYAAPDPSARASFVQAYQARFGGLPPPLADLAYDAASIAKAAAAAGGFSAAVITAPAYNGVDGPLTLDPDGQVRRALAVFAVGRGGNQLAEPAPRDVGPAAPATAFGAPLGAPPGGAQDAGFRPAGS